jgi:hypothetical protein
MRPHFSPASSMRGSRLLAAVFAEGLVASADDRTLEDFQGQVNIGSRTLLALHKLEEESGPLSVAAPIAPPPKPKPIPSLSSKGHLGG